MSLRIIAEIGVNHNGSMELAKRLIEEAKRCGADLAKFQTFSADRLAALSTPKVPYQLRTSDPKESHHGMLKKLELSCEAHRELKAYCERVGIEFISTPYSREDAVFLDELGVRRFKVASADIIDRALHEFLSSTGKECILAIGMATLDEIEETLQIYDARLGKERIVLLQCTSAYPADSADANLRVMETLKGRFRCRVGYSDHTLGADCAVVATALGAEVIEKHFTLDKGLPGPDHAASATPDELAVLIRAVRGVEAALGDGVKRISASEIAMRQVSRKSIVSTRNLPAGWRLTRNDIDFRRPGNGLSPMVYPQLLGRILKREISQGEPLAWDDLENSKA